MVVPEAEVLGKCGEDCPVCWDLVARLAGPIRRFPHECHAHEEAEEFVLLDVGDARDPGLPPTCNADCVVRGDLAEHMSGPSCPAAVQRDEGSRQCINDEFDTDVEMDIDLSMDEPAQDLAFPRDQITDAVRTGDEEHRPFEAMDEDPQEQPVAAIEQQQANLEDTDGLAATTSNFDYFLPSNEHLGSSIEDENRRIDINVDKPFDKWWEENMEGQQVSSLPQPQVVYLPDANGSYAFHNAYALAPLVSDAGEVIPQVRYELCDMLAHPTDSQEIDAPLATNQHASGGSSYGEDAQQYFFDDTLVSTIPSADFDLDAPLPDDQYVSRGYMNGEDALPYFVHETNASPIPDYDFNAPPATFPSCYDSGVDGKGITQYLHDPASVPVVPENWIDYNAPIPSVQHTADGVVFGETAWQHPIVPPIPQDRDSIEAVQIMDTYGTGSRTRGEQPRQFDAHVTSAVTGPTEWENIDPALRPDGYANSSNTSGEQPGQFDFNAMSTPATPTGWDSITAHLGTEPFANGTHNDGEGTQDSGSVLSEPDEEMKALIDKDEKEEKYTRRARERTEMRMKCSKKKQEKKRKGDIKPV